LNPHDIHTPLLVCFIGGRETSVERISLDWDDADMATYYDTAKQKNKLRFHENASKAADAQMCA
jgi:hypothetical protein